MTKRPWFKVWNDELISQCFGLSANEGFLFMVVALRSRAEGGPIEDTAEVLARRCSLRLYRAREALEALVSAGKILLVEGRYFVPDLHDEQAAVAPNLQKVAPNLPRTCKKSPRGGVKKPMNSTRVFLEEEEEEEEEVDKRAKATTDLFGNPDSSPEDQAPPQPDPDRYVRTLKELVLDDHLKAWAKAKCPAVPLDREMEAFRLWVQSSGRAFKCYRAALKNSLLRAQERAEQRGGGNVIPLKGEAYDGGESAYMRGVPTWKAQ